MKPLLIMLLMVTVSCGKKATNTNKRETTRTTTTILSEDIETIEKLSGKNTLEAGIELAFLINQYSNPEAIIKDLDNKLYVECKVVCSFKRK